VKRRLIAFFVAFAWLAGCGGNASSPVSLVPQGATGASSMRTASRVSPDRNVNELPEPPVVRAKNGVAAFTLIAMIDPATGLPSFQYDYLNGIAPTVELSPGETMKVTLINNLPPQGKAASLANLHFHGLTVSPRGDSDNVLGLIAQPGQTLHYVVHVPTNQEPGLYWYHMHVHGETSFQVGEGGMSGAIVIDGLEKHIPELARMKQRIIVVRSTGIGQNIRPRNDMADMDDTDDSDSMPADDVKPNFTNTHPCSFRDGLLTSLNGATRSVITIAPGERQFFRVVNATGHKTLRLNVSGEKVQVVAIDGFALDSYPGTPPTLTESSVIIPPAARAEFVVTGPASGRARFRTLCYYTGPNGDADPYIWFGDLMAPKHRQDGGDFSTAPLKVGAPLPSNFYNTALPPPVAKRVVVFSENAKPRFFINGKSFKLGAPPMFVVHTGTVEEWHIFNDTYEVHDFHIHQIHFLVTSINGVKVKHPYWADSFIVPHRTGTGKSSVPGSIVALMDFRDPIIRGEFVFHCHILDHEDAGMMAKIEVI
jgi:suppressor of ftsI